MITRKRASLIFMVGIVSFYCGDLSSGNTGSTPSGGGGGMGSGRSSCGNGSSASCPAPSSCSSLGGGGAVCIGPICIPTPSPASSSNFCSAPGGSLSLGGSRGSACGGGGAASCSRGSSCPPSSGGGGGACFGSVCLPQSSPAGSCPPAACSVTTNSPAECVGTSCPTPSDNSTTPQAAPRAVICPDKSTRFGNACIPSGIIFKDPGSCPAGTTLDCKIDVAPAVLVAALPQMLCVCEPNGSAATASSFVGASVCQGKDCVPACVGTSCPTRLDTSSESVNPVSTAQSASSDYTVHGGDNAREILIPMPPREVLQESFDSIGMGCLAEKTDIVDRLACQSLAVEGVAMAIELSVVDYLESIKPTMSTELFVTQQTLLDVKKPELCDAVIKAGLSDLNSRVGLVVNVTTASGWLCLDKFEKGLLKVLFKAKTYADVKYELVRFEKELTGAPPFPQLVSYKQSAESGDRKGKALAEPRSTAPAVHPTSLAPSKQSTESGDRKGKALAGPRSTAPTMRPASHNRTAQASEITAPAVTKTVVSMWTRSTLSPEMLSVTQP